MGWVLWQTDCGVSARHGLSPNDTVINKQISLYFNFFSSWAILLMWDNIQNAVLGPCTFYHQAITFQNFYHFCPGGQKPIKLPTLTFQERTRLSKCLFPALINFLGRVWWPVWPTAQESGLASTHPVSILLRVWCLAHSPEDLVFGFLWPWWIVFLIICL